MRWAWLGGGEPAGRPAPGPRVWPPISVSAGRLPGAPSVAVTPPVFVSAELPVSGGGCAAGSGQVIRPRAPSVAPHLCLSRSSARGSERGRDAHPPSLFQRSPLSRGVAVLRGAGWSSARGPERGRDAPHLCFSGAPRLWAAAHGARTRRGRELRRLRRDRASAVSAHEEERLPALGPGLACTPRRRSGRLR